jgi:hypothetical protein
MALLDLNSYRKRRVGAVEAARLTRLCNIERDGPSTRGRMSWGRRSDGAVGGNGTIVMWVRGPLPQLTFA